MPFPKSKDDIEIIIITRREGLLTKVGHDLQLRVRPHHFEIQGDDFSGDLEVKAIELEGALVGEEVQNMSSGDSSKILKTLRTKVFVEKRYPKISFSGRFEVPNIEVSLEINGVKNTLTLTQKNDMWTGKVDYRSYGISQVSALFGTLKVSPTVEVQVLMLA